MRRAVKIAGVGCVGVLALASVGQWLTGYYHDQQLDAWLQQLHSVPGLSAVWEPDTNNWLQRDGALQLTLEPQLVWQLSAGAWQPAAPVTLQWNVSQQLWPFYISGRAYLDSDVGAYQQLRLQQGIASIPHKLRWHINGLTRHFDTRLAVAGFELEQDGLQLTMAPLQLLLEGRGDRLSLQLQWQGGKRQRQDRADWQVEPLSVVQDWHQQDGFWVTQHQQWQLQGLTLPAVGVEVRQLAWQLTRQDDEAASRLDLTAQLACQQCQWAGGDVLVQQLQAQLQFRHLDRLAYQALWNGPMTGAVAQWQKLAALQQLVSAGMTVTIPEAAVHYNGGELQVSADLQLARDPRPVLSVASLFSRLEGQAQLTASEALIRQWPNAQAIQQWQQAGYLQPVAQGWSSRLQAKDGRVTLNGTALPVQSVR